MPFWLIDSKIEDDVRIFPIINKQEFELDLPNFQEFESKFQRLPSSDIFIIIIIIEQPQQAALKGTISLGGVRRRGKTGEQM